jgi:hypothetical protein
MPSVSKKQHNFMAAVANNPKFAKKVGIPKATGEEFMKADKGRKFKEGGAMKHSDVKMDKKVVKKAVGMHEKQLHGGKKSNLTKLRSGGSCKGYEEGGSIASKLKKYSPNAYETVEEDEAEIASKGASMLKNAKEGNYGKAAIDAVKGLGTTAKMYTASMPKAAMHAAKNRLLDGPKKDAEGKKAGGKVGYKAGGKVRGCGMATKGLTKGKMV